MLESGHFIRNLSSNKALMNSSALLLGLTNAWMHLQIPERSELREKYGLVNVAP
jgi:hypothetical protein